MAEIEHFLPLNDSSHSKFASVSSLLIALWPAAAQEAGISFSFSRSLSRARACSSLLARSLAFSLTLARTHTGAPAEVHSIGHAVAAGMVSNEALGYYLGKTALFFDKCGLAATAARPLEGNAHPPTLPRVRFRQHRRNEMAHYAADCWDAEVRTSAYGWIEVVGHADRASYDLEMHSKATGMYPPPHMTRMYPPPHMTRMYPPSRMTCMYPPPYTTDSVVLLLDRNTAGRLV